jgi:hypothetical protein
MSTSYVLLACDNGKDDIWFYLTASNYNNQKMGGWGPGPAAERNLAEFMRSPPDVPYVLV